MRRYTVSTVYWLAKIETPLSARYNLTNCLKSRLELTPTDNFPDGL